MTPMSNITRIIARQDAIAAGQAWYYTGKPCKRNHIAKRGTVSRSCYMCDVVHTRAYIKRNPQKKRIWDKNYYDKNPGKSRELARVRGWRRDGIPAPTRMRPSRCECCGGKPDFGRVLVLDHCHAKKRFRGWLCNRCNLGLGHFLDSPVRLRKAIAYLGRKR